jgi:HK97 family phage major capsid protein
MAGIITTGSFQLPDQLYGKVWDKIEDGSVLAKLAPQEGFTYGSTDIITFTGKPKAEFVAEAGNKSSALPEFGKKTVATHKAQVTVRMTDEVLFMSEDQQVQLMDPLTTEIAVALARALDLGAIHAINPLDGEKAASITDYIAATPKSVTVKDPLSDLDAAIDALLVDDYTPDGIALSATYANKYRSARNSSGEVRLFPEVPLNVKMTGNIQGINAAVSSTVNAKEAKTATNVEGIIGDFADGFKWGIVRNIPLQTIQFGDPDGQGDLQRTNQIAIRAEVYYAWAVMDPNAFVKVVKASS